ncbi:MAG: LysE family translocator [Gammaproteobacteria bacterium]|nr:LysE family translocator [Gammaproteobacteria bacterium]CAJ2376846.1 MAG: Homoserine/homoserine lactone efflux protein [Arenicellales bacterium IbO2]MDA7961429.1 LysE family translocator [Gammaproteobacteria bacterium]MDA7969613.1 LysE family translocator [Gammaproteobacteria bacterium]MDA7971856.1 LysE family translocator [Gammaproteobacteria bacterium]
MSAETWLLFAAAASLVLIIPGPTALLLLCRSLAHGRRSTPPLVAGVVAGDFTAMTCSLLGLGAVLAASAAWFALFKWAGAAYLVYLGVKFWRAPWPLREEEMRAARAATQSAGGRAFFREAFAVTALNPKSILFFIAFLPQFVQSESAAAALPQLLIMGATFLVLAALNAAMYSLCAAAIGAAVTRPSVQNTLRRTGGLTLAGAGLLAASLQRPA